MASVSVAIALVGAEAALHYLGPRAKPEPGKVFYEHDDLLGWHKIPNEEGVLVQPEYAVHKKINSKSLRGPEWSYEKPQPGLFRILFLGDSYCEGYAVELCDLFTEKLQKLLDSRHAGRYEVMNGGTGGYSTDQELLFFQTEGYKYQPDLVILLFYYNDVVVNTQDAYWEYPKPLFKLDGDELRLTNVPVPMPGCKEKAEEPSLTEWLSRDSRIYSFFADTLPQVSRLWSGDTSPPPMPPSWREFIVFQSSPSRETQNAWMLTEALLRRLRDEVHASGSELVIFHVPFKATVYLDEFDALRRRYRIPAELCDADRPGRDLAAVCGRLSIPLIDPLNELRNQAEILKRQGKRLYFALDDHWTAEGNESVARILYDHVAARVSSGE
ncbi:MAG: SGNH/GDSL hydrolase family protein [Candidatus Coatesbacteria bacterium]|nr:SGNH/GDSL hydrolase family protein [Candidatus Coatesbacteria bacterium]